MYKRILVATDGSTLSKKAVASAIQLAATCAAELVAIKVVPRYPQAYFEGSIPLSGSEIGRIEKEWTDAAQANLDAVAKAAKAKGVVTKTVTVKSDVVSDAIIAAAKKQQADLIVMASHGRKGIKRLLLGSETQQVRRTRTFRCWCCAEGLTPLAKGVACPGSYSLRSPNRPNRLPPWRAQRTFKRQQFEFVLRLVSVHDHFSD
jgi:nucleotide-binding universal stress UspA family protein